MKKLLFVYNPHSGKCQILTHLAEIIDIFTKGGYEVTAHPTQARDDAMETVRRRAADFDLSYPAAATEPPTRLSRALWKAAAIFPWALSPQEL